MIDAYALEEFSMHSAYVLERFSLISAYNLEIINIFAQQTIIKYFITCTKEN